MRFEKHVFICTHERSDSNRNSCGEETGLELVKAFKKAVKELPIKIRAQRAGCLDVCDFGPSVAIYPEGVFYGKVNLEDVDEIVQKHLINNEPVKRLILQEE